jgi:hypothetical protein
MPSISVSAKADHTLTTDNLTWLVIPAGKTASVTPDPNSTWTWDPNSGRSCNYTGNGDMDANQPDLGAAQGALLWFRMELVRPQPTGAVTAQFFVADQGHWSPGETTKQFLGPDQYLFQINDDNLGDNDDSSIKLNVIFA